MESTSPASVQASARSAGSEGVVAALYAVQPADTPDRIAERFSVPLELFMAVNPEVGRLDRVFAGQIVQIPLTPPTLPVQARVATEYVAREGDSLFSIARRYDISIMALRQANPLIDPDRLFAGEVLLVPTVSTWAPAMSTLLYVVQPGDTPAMVSALFGFSVEALTQANPQRINPGRLYAGEFIVLPVAGVPEQPVFDRVRYIVQPLDAIEDITRQFEIWPFGLGRLNAIVAPIPGLLLQLPASIPIPAPPQLVGVPAARPAPFGRKLALSDDDSTWVPFPADFQFPFYGRQQAGGVWVNSNGSVTFGEADVTYLPTTDAFIEGQPRIAPFWTDLASDAAAGTGGVYVEFYFDPEIENTRMAITWDRVPIFGGEGFYTLQLLLSEDGGIEMVYFAVPPLPAGEEPRILVGVSAGRGAANSNVFLYNGDKNQRRAGANAELVPQGDISGRALLYRYDQEQDAYRLSFT